MTTLSSRRFWLASIPAALLLGATTVRAQATGAAAPAGGVIRAALTEVPVDRIHLNTDQVRLLLAAHHPAIVDGISDDNSITIILASNGAYLASSSTKAPIATAAVARGGGGGGGGVMIAASGGARSGGGGGAGGAAGGFAARGTSGGSIATASPTPAGEVRRVGQMTFPGIGTLDADVVHDTYFTSYEAGELVANPVRVRFVVLVPNAVIK
jgi:hypothetical protein